MLNTVYPIGVGETSSSSSPSNPNNGNVNSTRGHQCNYSITDCINMLNEVKNMILSCSNSKNKKTLEMIMSKLNITTAALSQHPNVNLGEVDPSISTASPLENFIISKLDQLSKKVNHLPEIDLSASIQPSYVCRVKNPTTSPLTVYIKPKHHQFHSLCPSSPSGYGPMIYDDPFLELSNGHYSLSSVDIDCAVPCKIRNTKNSYINTFSHKNGLRMGNDGSVILGRRGMRQRTTNQITGATADPIKSSLPGSYKRFLPVKDAGTNDLEAIDMELDLDLDEDEIERFGYSSLKIYPSIKTSPVGKNSHRPVEVQVEGSPAESKESPMGSNRNNDKISNGYESKSSTEARENLTNEMVSTFNKEGGFFDDGADYSASRKRGFLHKFSLLKWASSASSSKPKKSYSKEALLRSNDLKEMDKGRRETEKVGEGDEENGQPVERDEDTEKPESAIRPSKTLTTKSDLDDNTSNQWSSDFSPGNGSYRDPRSVHMGYSHNPVESYLLPYQSLDSPPSKSNQDYHSIKYHSATSLPNEENCQMIDPSSPKYNSYPDNTNNYVNLQIKDYHRSPFKAAATPSAKFQSPIKFRNHPGRLPKDHQTVRSITTDDLGLDMKPDIVYHPSNKLPPPNSNHQSTSSTLSDKHSNKSANHLQRASQHLDPNYYPHQPGNSVSECSPKKENHCSMKPTVITTPVIKESRLIGEPTCSSAPDTSKVSNPGDAEDNTCNLSSSDSKYQPTPGPNQSQSVPILSNTVYGVKNVKKAKIKELPPLNYEDSPSSGPSSPSSPKSNESRKKIFEKGPGTKNTRGLRRRRNGNRAWYDVSDDEDGLVTRKFNSDNVTNSTKSQNV